MKIVLKFYATLSDYLPAGSRDNQIEVEVDADATIETILAPYGLPQKLVHLVLVNGTFVPPAQRSARRLAPGDQLAVWPPIAGG